jgi:phenylalanine-4-hydroxylase
MVISRLLHPLPRALAKGTWRRSVSVYARHGCSAIVPALPTSFSQYPDRPMSTQATYSENAFEIQGPKVQKEEVISGGLGPRTSVLMEVPNYVGALHDVLKLFWKYEINMTRIESRPAKASSGSLDSGAPKFDFFVDFDGQVGDSNVDKLLESVKRITSKTLVLDEKQVHWFPHHISELDLVVNRTLDAGKDLESDHPGFNDPVYRARRANLTELAQNHRWDRPIPKLDYTEEEIATWAAVWDKMEGLWDKYACSEYKTSLSLLKKNCGYDQTSIPQQQDISEFLKSHTNFTMRPVAGLLSSRDFLNGLAFRVFFSTQYIRHHSMPLYTPEPDICHELLGHAPMFADKVRSWAGFF